MRKRLFLLMTVAAACAMAQTGADAWTMHGRNNAAWRYAEFNEINTGNVQRLTPKWIRQVNGAGRMAATPLVRDGLLFGTGSANLAFALDVLTGREVWRHQTPVPKGAQGCCGPVNRGFALHGDRLFKVNFEGTLIALDTKTGKKLWESSVADHKLGYSATAAPLIAGDKVIVGIAGAEFGTRDFLDAYSVSTGERLWRFWTIPAPGEPGASTWPSDAKRADAWKRGGGSTWITGSYDPELNLIYWGTGNPGPDMNGDMRPGDNLYTCSVIAVDATTGKLRWHYQFTPHDVHDWDSTEDMVLADLTIEGRMVKALLHADRNGFYYTLDRTNGKLIAAKAYTKVTWAKGIGADGRPILVAGQDPTEAGAHSCPGSGGGHNWQPTAFSPQTGLYYFGSSDGCDIYFQTEHEYITGQWYQLSVANGAPDEERGGSVVAVDPKTGGVTWRLPLLSSPGAGMLATGGGLVFTGDREGNFMAMDAETGKVLWHFPAGAGISSGPISYRFRGKQYIVVAAGNSVIAFGIGAP